MATKNRGLLSGLADWLQRAPEDFADEQAMSAVGWLIEHAAMAGKVRRANEAHRAMWFLLPEDARGVASRRQLAAYATRLGMRNGMEKLAAIRWVIALAGMGRRDFRRACADALTNGDSLLVWQWRELTKIGLTDDFVSRRQVDQWLELEEPWLFDARWVYPLHLVDKDVLARHGATVKPPEDDDANA